jgi:hypothetical protein
MNLTEVTDLTSIGTLFAFILVSGGVLVLEAGWKKNAVPASEKGFQVPYFNSRYLLPVIWIVLITLFYYWNRADFEGFQRYIARSESNTLWSDSLKIITHHFPVLLFVLTAIVVTWFAVVKEYSLIPVLGLLTNFYLMAQLGVTNWLRFLLWLAIGLVIYFSYGRRHSRQGNGTTKLIN